MTDGPGAPAARSEHPPRDGANDRSARLAAAMRANLKRRKRQQRERGRPGEPTDASVQAAVEPDPTIP